MQGDYTEAKTYEAVKKALGKAKHPVFYLEIPPSLFADGGRSSSATRA